MYACRQAIRIHKTMGGRKKDRRVKELMKRKEKSYEHLHLGIITYIYTRRGGGEVGVEGGGAGWAGWGRSETTDDRYGKFRIPQTNPMRLIAAAMETVIIKRDRHFQVRTSLR